MRTLFCSDELNPRAVDSCYENEAIAAAESRLQPGLIDFTAIRRGNADAAVRFLHKSDAVETVVYRGWMLTPVEYRLLHDSLAALNLRMINSPEEYLNCHWFPNSYSEVEEWTPRSVWVPIPDSPWDMDAIANVLNQFGTSPVIVKDYVKSRKHEWKEACFIPDASDRKHAAQVISRFIELQEDDLQGGLVFREFVDFEPVGTHPKSGMPLTLEYRLFVLDGKVIAASPYWEGQNHTKQPPVADFEKRLRHIKSHFFTCDIAKEADGRWLIVELGDGQVAGLPERCNPEKFYKSIARRMGTENESHTA